MKIGIFGSGGLLGSDLISVGKRKAWDMLSYHRDINIADAPLVLGRLEQDRPDWIVNTAGESNVDAAEKNPDYAFLINEQGVGNVAQACARLSIPLVHISTDYVFSGDPEHIFHDDDPLSPINNYGRSKAGGELQVRKSNQHYNLRVSSLFGFARETHATRVIQAIRTNTMVKIASDMICSPTNTIHLAEMIFSLIEKRPPFGQYNAVAKNSCSRYEFAEEICRLLGAKSSIHLEDIKINSLGLPAKRPEVLRLSTSKWQKLIGPLPTWQEGLHQFIRDFKN